MLCHYHDMLLTISSNYTDSQQAEESVWIPGRPDSMAIVIDRLPAVSLTHSLSLCVVS